MSKSKKWLTMLLALENQRLAMNSLTNTSLGSYKENDMPILLFDSYVGNAWCLMILKIKAWNHSFVHQRLDFGFHIFELCQLEAMLFNFFFLVRRFFGFHGSFYFWRRLLAVTLQHLQYRISLFLQLCLLICVHVANHIFNRRRRPI